MARFDSPRPRVFPDSKAQPRRARAQAAAARPSRGRRRARSSSIGPKNARPRRLRRPTSRCSSPSASGQASRARPPRAIVAALPRQRRDRALPTSPGPGFINFTLAGESRFAVVAAGPRGRARSAAATRHDRHEDHGGVRLRQSHRAAARGARTPGRARRRDLGAARVAGLARHARVLLQRRRRRRSPTSRSRCRRASREARGEAARCPRTAITATTSARSRSEYVAAHFGDVAGDEPRRRSASSRSPTCASEQDLDLQAFGVQFDSYFLESLALHRRQGRRDRARCCVKRGPHLRDETARCGCADHRLRRRQGPRDAQVRRHVHVLRARRRLPPDQVAARLRARDQRAGRRPPLARSRACAPGCRRSTSAFRKGYPDYVLHQMVTVMQRRRGGEDLQARRHATSTRARPDRRGRPRRRALFLPHARKSDSQLVFDIDLAKSQTDDNPVYYVQYAHARAVAACCANGAATRPRSRARTSRASPRRTRSRSRRSSRSFPRLRQRARAEIRAAPRHATTCTTTWRRACIPTTMPSVSSSRMRSLKRAAPGARRRNATGARQRPRRARRQRSRKNVMPKGLQGQLPAPRAESRLQPPAAARDDHRPAAGHRDLARGGAVAEPPLQSVRREGQAVEPVAEDRVARRSRPPPPEAAKRRGARPPRPAKASPKARRESAAEGRARAGPRFEFYQILPGDEGRRGQGREARAKAPPRKRRRPRGAARPGSSPVDAQGALAARPTGCRPAPSPKSSEADNLKAKIALTGLEATVRAVDDPRQGNALSRAPGPVPEPATTRTESRPRCPRTASARPSSAPPTKPRKRKRNPHVIAQRSSPPLAAAARAFASTRRPRSSRYPPIIRRSPPKAAARSR